MEARFRIEGMSCEGCVRSVRAALERIGLKAEISLVERTLTVTEPVDEAKLRAAVEAAGYDFGGRLL